MLGRQSSARGAHGPPLPTSPARRAPAPRAPPDEHQTARRARARARRRPRPGLVSSSRAEPCGRGYSSRRRSPPSSRSGRGSGGALFGPPSPVAGSPGRAAPAPPTRQPRPLPRSQDVREGGGDDEGVGNVALRHDAGGDPVGGRQGQGGPVGRSDPGRLQRDEDAHLALVSQRRAPWTLEQPRGHRGGGWRARGPEPAPATRHAPPARRRRAGRGGAGAVAASCTRSYACLPVFQVARRRAAGPAGRGRRAPVLSPARRPSPG